MPPKYSSALTFFVCALMFASVVLLVTHQRSYVEAMLEHHNMHETVYVRGNPVTLVGGRVGSHAVSDADVQTARRTALLLLEARTTPLLAIAGTDPEQLHRAIDRLEDVQRMLADHQTDPSDISNVNALYPIPFLRSLAELEVQRLIFLEERSDAAARAYEAALFKAITIGKVEAERFTTALSQSISALHERAAGFPDLYSLSGTISRKSLLAALPVLEKRFDQVALVAHERRECRLELRRCRALPELNENVHKPSVDVPLPSSDIRTSLEEYARPLLQQERAAYAVLDDGVCTRELGSPTVYMRFPGRTPADGSRAYFLTDALYLAPTHTEQTGTVQYLLRERGVQYIPVLPLSFYVCPESQYDLGRLAVIAEGLHFSRQHAEILPRMRETLLTQIDVHFADIEDYISTALTLNTLSEEERRAIEQLYLMARDRSAHMDALVRVIASVIENMIVKAESGVPFQTAADNLFITHSAFPSLFLTHSPGAGAAPLHLTVHDQRGTEQFLQKHTLYSDTISEVTFAEIMEDFSIVRELDTI